MEIGIAQIVQNLKNKIIERRRDFHKYAETGWTEFRTASIIADTLQNLGYQVFAGDDVIDTAFMMGLPEKKELENQAARAINQGANPFWVEKMQGGKTGVVGIMQLKTPGPVLALRFDIDANDVAEAETEEHRPYKEGFSSVNKGVMHACGHDGHAAIGLALAEVLTSIQGHLNGTIKLIFQPAEEGVRGAKSMMLRGIVDDVDYFIGMHLGTSLFKLGQVCCETGGFLATTKLDAIYTGQPAHAGMAPESGRNALLAAATALLNLHAISRHSQGTSRINVGILQGGTGRNVIPDHAVLKLETRGSTSLVNEYMQHEAERIIKAAALMQDVSVSIKEMGSASGCNSTPEFSSIIKRIAQENGLFEEYIDRAELGGSEDVSFFMERVQQRGGQAAYLLIGTELAAGHHNSYFDFNEDVLPKAVSFLSIITKEILTNNK